MESQVKPILFPTKVHSEPVFDSMELHSLGRKLSSIVKNSSNPAVISLEAPWGEGKSTFLRHWQGKVKAEIESRPFPICWIDASIGQHHSSPKGLIHYSLLNEINRLSEDGSDNPTLPEKILKAIPNVAVSLTSRGTIGSAELSLEKGSRKGFAWASEFQKEFQEWSKLRIWLSKYGEWLREASGFPLVVVIDEIDRCNPAYAMELIEVARHFFSTDNTVFVLSMNRDQLEAHVVEVYGSGTKPGVYLEKYIDLRIPLRQAGVKDSFKVAVEFSGYLGRIHAFNKFPESNWRFIHGGFVAGAILFGMSLRQMEQAALRFALTCTISDESFKDIEYGCLTLLSCLVTSDPVSFNIYRENKYEPTDGLIALGKRGEQAHATLESDGSVGGLYGGLISWNLIGRAESVLKSPAGEDYYHPGPIVNQFLSQRSRSLIPFRQRLCDLVWDARVV